MTREGFTVRILRGDSAMPAGVGFVVGDRHIVTCAHVVNTALGRTQKSQDKPGTADRIRVEFPMLGDGDGAPLRTCKVQAWTPPALSGFSSGDVAGLVLVGEGLPAGAGAALLNDAAAMRDTAVQVFGYPGDPPRQEMGAWSSMVLRGAVGGGVIQLDAGQGSAIRAQPGYSGSPVVVWDGSADAVLGMLAIAGHDEATRDAYAIPAARLTDEWPEIKRSAGSHVPLPSALEVGLGVSAVAFSSDGTRLATLASARARIWNLGTGAAMLELPAELAAGPLAFSRDGTRLATGSSDETARIWDADTGKLQVQLAHDDAVAAVAFSPDGTRLATGSSDETARIWHISTGRQQLQVTHHLPMKQARKQTQKRAFKIGMTVLSYWVLVASRFIPDGTVLAVAFSPDGARLATGSKDRSVRIWDADTGELQVQLAHDDAVAAVAFSPDGTRLATGSDTFARVWDVGTGQPRLQVNHDSAVRAVAFSSDATRLITASGISAQIWDATTGRQQRKVTYSNRQTYIRKVMHDTRGLAVVAVGPDGTRLATCDDKTAQIWDLEGR